MTTTPDTRPDVAAFVADVRGRLGDLTAEDRDDLLDGLEADLADQLADGAGALPDPATYAAELRAAAGLPASSRRPRRVSWPSAAHLGGGLDDIRAWWSGLVDEHPAARQAWAVAVALLPAWWALRAWVAVTLLDQAAGPREPVTVLPGLQVPGLGLVVLVAAVAVSVLVGQRRTWSAAPPRVRQLLRLGVVVLNAVAVIGLVALVEHSADTRYELAGGYDVGFDAGYGDASTIPFRGVVVDGRSVHNLYPYDAAGLPLVGVQLYDGAGRRVSLTRDQATSASPDGKGLVVGCPWVNGSLRLYNVFPLPERAQLRGYCRPDLDTKLGPGVVPPAPLTQVPPVVLPTAAPAG